MDWLSQYDLSFLPLLNAVLNSIALVLLIAGLVLIRRKRIAAHRAVMLSAFAVSTAFLVLYVLHKTWRGAVGEDLNSTYHGEGLLRTAYLVILLTHVVLAMTVPVFAIALIVLGLKRRDATHRKVARWGWPIWVYVSVTGVVIYLMLYPFNPVPDDPPPTEASTPGSAATVAPSARAPLASPVDAPNL